MIVKCDPGIEVSYKVPGDTVYVINGIQQET